MIPSLEGWQTKAKEAPSPHEVRLAPLDTNTVFQNLGGVGWGGGILDQTVLSHDIDLSKTFKRVTKKLFT